MAHTLDPMDLKQIITLCLDGLSNRQIGEILDISRNTVNGYIKLFTACDHSFEELRAMDEPSLRELFPSHTTIVNDRYNQLMLYFEKVNQARNHPGFTFQYHYNEYKSTAKNPYSYSQFMEHYNRKYAKIKGSMKLEHQAGHELFIDFAGKKLQVANPETGEVQDVEVFVSILPHSQYTYAEACTARNGKTCWAACPMPCRFTGASPKRLSPTI